MQGKQLEEYLAKVKEFRKRKAASERNRTQKKRLAQTDAKLATKLQNAEKEKKRREELAAANKAALDSI